MRIFFTRFLKTVGILLLILVVLTAFALASGAVKLPWATAAAEKVDPPAKETLAVALVKGKPHTLEVPEHVRAVLGIRKGKQDLFAVAQRPTTMRPLVLSGSTALDPARLARIRARFAPARVVEIGQVQDAARKTGQTELRELRPGDRVRKGDVLGIFYSVDVGSKKNDLLDALVQLELDQKILDHAEKHREAVPEVFMLTADSRRAGRPQRDQPGPEQPRGLGHPPRRDRRSARGGQEDCADKNAWYKTREGRWVKGEKASRQPMTRSIPTRTARTPGAGLPCGPRSTASSSSATSTWTRWSWTTRSISFKSPT